MPIMAIAALSVWDMACSVTQSHRASFMSSLVAYYRVSTQRQGRSGLGLEAQRKAVASFAEAEDFTSRAPQW